MSAAQQAPLRVLLVHNAYQQRGGEDSVVEAELALLRSRGHVVETYFRHNDDLAAMPAWQAAGQMLWSGQTAREIGAQIAASRPDVIHVHNTFPLISPSLYWAADRAGVPVVQTLHNFRLHCPQAMYLREGKVCEDCLGHIPWRGALRACYRGSRPQSAALASMVTLHRAIGTWQHKVTRYIALNEFCRRKFIEGGLPAERVVVKPNFVDFAAPPDGPREGFLFVGRLSAEKGVDVLAAATTQLAGCAVRVAGTGPEASRFEGLGGVSMLGRLGREQVYSEMSSALALVFPSICYETFGLVLVEAFAMGTPVIGSRLGVVPDLIEEGVTGLLFEPGNADDLAAKMRWALANREAMAAMGRNARQRYEQCYTAERNYAQLLQIYREAIGERG